MDAKTAARLLNKEINKRKISLAAAFVFVTVFVILVLLKFSLYVCMVLLLLSILFSSIYTYLGMSEETEVQVAVEDDFISVSVTECVGEVFVELTHYPLKGFYYFGVISMQPLQVFSQYADSVDELKQKYPELSRIIDKLYAKLAEVEDKHAAVIFAHLI